MLLNEGGGDWEVRPGRGGWGVGGKLESCDRIRPINYWICWRYDKWRCPSPHWCLWLLQGQLDRVSALLLLNHIRRFKICAVFFFFFQAERSFFQPTCNVVEVRLGIWSKVFLSWGHLHCCRKRKSSLRTSTQIWCFGNESNWVRV